METGSERMKVFVTGVAGQLGHDVMQELKKQELEAVGSDLASSNNSSFPYISMDITETDQVRKTILTIKPDAVIHCAAWTAVDAAEEEDNKAKVFRINSDGTENIAKVCKELNCKLMYISTDYVFNGEGSKPWSPDSKDCKPLNVYGESKLKGEQAVSANLSKYFIVRISWGFGTNGKNFIKTMLELAKNHDTLKVISDQIGTPTYTFDLARLLIDMIITDKYGYYHATNEGGYISWYEFARAIFTQAGLSTKVIPITTEEYGLSKAKRPLNSRLDKEKLTKMGFERLPSWQDALMRYLKILQKN